jgi:hypothetical protein
LFFCFTLVNAARRKVNYMPWIVTVKCVDTVTNAAASRVAARPTQIDYSVTRHVFFFFFFFFFQFAKLPTARGFA